MLDVCILLSTCKRSLSDFFLFSFSLKKKKKNQKIKNHPFILTYTRGRAPARGERVCRCGYCTYDVQYVHMYMYMYEVDRVYGLTESGKNLSLSLSLFLPGLGWVGPWEWGGAGTETVEH